MLTFSRATRRSRTSRGALISVVGSAAAALGIFLAACSSSSTPSPAGDASTAADGGDGAAKVGCKSGFPKAGDRCTQGESCVEEGNCEPDASLARYGCDTSNTLVEVGRFPCPTQ